MLEVNRHCGHLDALLRIDRERFQEAAAGSPDCTRPVLSILMPSLKQRAALRLPLLTSLQEQVDACSDRVELLIELDSGQATSGQKRNMLLERSRGYYVAFVDDDDMVAGDYVETLLAGCGSWPDVVGFLAKMTLGGKREILQSFSMQYADRQKLGGGVIGMRANHLCAWRRDLATAVGFPPHLGYNDDCFWYKPLHLAGSARVERYCHKVLYEYRYDAGATQNQTAMRQSCTRGWAGPGVEVFGNGVAVYTALVNKPISALMRHVPVWGPFGKMLMLDREEPGVRELGEVKAA